MKAILSSTVEKKFVVAVTGILIFGFLCAHMAGNLKTFWGVEPHSGFHHLDIYAAFLRNFGELLIGQTTLLWIVRCSLITCVAVHIFLVTDLWIRNRRARPVAYQYPQRPNSSYASRHMMLTGAFLVTFIIFHLLHLTFGKLPFHEFSEGHVYANVYNAFRIWWLAGIYVLAMLVLAIHVYHAIWSFFQTLGLDSPDRNPALRTLAKFCAVMLLVGFSSVPIAIAAGLLNTPPAKFLQF